MHSKNESEVNNIIFPFPLSNNKTYARQNNLKGIKLFKYWLSIHIGYIKNEIKLRRTLRKKKCYYGAFKGEFGHFLAHNLPFLMYLHSKNVKIIYCGMELHSAFLIDENNNSILYDYKSLRNFFHEVPPNSNSTIPPVDIQNEITKFEADAYNSKMPFWNISNDFYYWFIHRNWLKKKYMLTYDLSKVYKSKNENSVCIFSRSKGAKSSHNNGESWDYESIIDKIKPFYDKVYVVGNPLQSLNIESSDKVEVWVTSDNKKIIEACSNSSLIITQHSGAIYLGEYVRTDVLVIYKGGNKLQDIGSLNNTLRFKNEFKNYSRLHFAFNEEQIIKKIKEINRL